MRPSSNKKTNKMITKRTHHPTNINPTYDTTRLPLIEPHQPRDFPDEFMT